MATHPPHVQSYSVKAFGPFFTWVYHAEDVAVTSLDDFEKMDMPVTMNQLKFLQGLHEPSLLQRIAADMWRPKTNIKEIQDRASAYQKQQWINWHWGAAPDSVIHRTRSMFPSQAGRQTCKQGKRNLSCVSRGESGRECTVARLGCPLVGSGNLRLRRRNGKRSARRDSGRQWEILIQSMGHQWTLVACVHDWHSP